MFDIKPDDLISKTDQLLFCILEELRQLNKSLHPIAKDTVIKKKSKTNSKPRNVQPKNETSIDGGGLIGSNSN